MKRFLSVLTCGIILLTLTGCLQTQKTNEQTSSSPDLVLAEPSAPAAEPTPRQTEEANAVSSTDLVFSYSDVDPLADAVDTNATVTLNGYLYEEHDVYRGEISLLRCAPEADTMLKYRFDSVDFAAKVGAKSQKVHFQSYYSVSGTDISTYFHVEYPVGIRRSSLDEMLCSLSEKDGVVSLTLWLSDTDSITVSGKPGKPELPTPVSMEEAPRLMISDSFFTTGVMVDRNIYRVLCTGEKSKGGYGGTLRLSRTLEQFLTVSYLSSGEGESWEEPFFVTFQPFDRAEYLEAGGGMGEYLTAPLSAMGVTKAGANTAIFTVSGSQVFLELPEAVPGAYFIGKMDDRSDGARIAEEETVLWKQDYLFRTAPHDGAGDVEGFLEDVHETEDMMGMEYSQEQLDYFAELYGSYFNELRGQSLWLPPDFIPMPSAIDLAETPPTGDTFGCFSYTCAGYFTDEIYAVMQEHFKDMRGVYAKDGLDSGHYVATVQFYYGEAYVDVSMSLIPGLGVGVSVDLFRHN